MKKMANLRTKLIDIGANLTDEMYQGVYNGSKKHAPDLNLVLERSWKANLDKIIITGGSLEESKKALELARTNSNLFCTVGCHPTRCNEMIDNPDLYLDGLRSIIRDGGNKVVAIGECGLDYERIKFCKKDVQLKYFEQQLKLSGEFKLPLFLHCRGAAGDLIDIISRNKQSVHSGVVHSYDGSYEDAVKMIDLGLNIGINGCSLRTEENINVARGLPLSHIMIETDAPWCEVKQSHAGYKYVKTKFNCVKKEKYNPDRDFDVQVKNRNEPANIIHVLEILSGIRNRNEDDLALIFYENSIKLFFNK